MPETVVLLHGFGATHRAWDGVVARLHPERYLPIALDLPGHGEAAHITSGEETGPTGSIGFAGSVEQVFSGSPESFHLCGYSLGGRIALYVALTAPERVRRLVLVSCAAGIEDPSERAARRAADHRLARELEEKPYEDFIERWRTQPLFAAEPSEVGVLAREDQRRNRPQAMAAVLRGLGTGEMDPPLWDRLGELKMPTTVVVGERDAKYRALGQRMVELLPNAELVVLAGGHGLPLENPAGVASMID